jgi:hypothetical protein
VGNAKSLNPQYPFATLGQVVKSSATHATYTYNDRIELLTLSHLSPPLAFQLLILALVYLGFSGLMTYNTLRQISLPQGHLQPAVLRSK